MYEFALELHQAHRRLGLLEPRRLLKPLASPGFSPCLPNPGYQPVRRLVGPALEQVATDADEVNYWWLDRATGRTSSTDAGWYFAGRTNLTTRIASFLRAGRGLLLITGAAGIGKSAIIALTVTLSDPGFRTDPRYQTALTAASATSTPSTPNSPPGNTPSTPGALAVHHRRRTRQTPPPIPQKLAATIY